MRALLLVAILAALRREPSSALALVSADREQYVIALGKQAATSEELGEVAEGKRRVSVADESGKRYSCLMPEAAEAADVTQPVEETSQRQRNASELLSELNGACFHRIEGWWTFELCVRKHLRQFHSEDNRVLSEYVLGTFDQGATDKLHSAQAPAAEDASRFHSHMLTGGTSCELTGQPRSAEVRFVCATEGAQGIGAAGEVAQLTHFIESVKEPVTCTYVVQFATPLLCESPAFKEAEPPVSQILCRPEG